MSKRILSFLFLLSTVVIGTAWAQANFSEGTLVYRIDTLRRLEKHPAAYQDAQFKLYKKGDLIRVERLSVNRHDPTDTKRSIEIRNQKGIYTLLEESKPAFSIDSLLKSGDISRDSLAKIMPMLLPMLEDFALFTSYEEERAMRSMAALQGTLKTFTIRNLGPSTSLLSLPTEKLVIVGSDQQDTTQVLVTQKLAMPVGLFFDALQKVAGTPLQFTESKFGWQNRYTIESISTQPVPDSLFQIDARLPLKTTEQLLKELGDIK